MFRVWERALSSHSRGLRPELGVVVDETRNWIGEVARGCYGFGHAGGMFGLEPAHLGGFSSLLRLESL